MIEKLQSQFIQLVTPITGFFVVIDALDEATQKQRKKIFKMILNLVSKLPCTRIFATSRKEPDIISWFSLLKTPTVEISRLIFGVLNARLGRGLVFDDEITAQADAHPTEAM